MDGHYDTVVIGGGQAGLAAGYYLRRLAWPRFLILDAGHRAGDAWRQRWDALRLFTPAPLDGLPGLPFPGGFETFPSKDAMADYLERYAERFDLPIRFDTRVERVERDGSRFVLTAADLSLSARAVIVATGGFHHPRVPDFATALSSDIVQLHSTQYRRPSQLGPGPVLVVGAGNSGAEIAMTLAPTHVTWLAGRSTGHLPLAPGGPLRWRLFRWVANRLLTLDTPVGRAFERHFSAPGDPLLRLSERPIRRAGITRLPRVTGIRDGCPRLDDGRVMKPATIVWCTGFHLDFSWIALPAFDADGRPRHHRGMVADVPGLYFLGLPFLYSLASSTVDGIGRDAEHVVEEIARQR